MFISFCLQCKGTNFFGTGQMFCKIFLSDSIQFWHSDTRDCSSPFCFPSGNSIGIGNSLRERVPFHLRRTHSSAGWRNSIGIQSRASQSSVLPTSCTKTGDPASCCIGDCPCGTGNCSQPGNSIGIVKTPVEFGGFGMESRRSLDGRCPDSNNSIGMETGGGLPASGHPAFGKGV